MKINKLIKINKNNCQIFQNQTANNKNMNNQKMNNKKVNK